MKLLVGSSGLLGSGFCETLSGSGEDFVRVRLPWGDPDGVAAGVAGRWVEAAGRRPGQPITLVWAAGTGAIGAGGDAMAEETATLRAVVSALRSEVTPDLRSRFLFASSAGAIYGGHGPGEIADGAPPSPITPYGREKVLQEALVGSLADAGVMSTLACRFTNLFGLAHGSLRRKGLVAAVLHSALTRQPAPIFVSQDTRRDYLTNRDAAALALAEASSPAGADRRTAVIRAGSTMTVGDIVASIGRVLRRRVPVVYVDSPESSVQPMALQFPPRSGAQAEVRTRSFEAAVRLLAEAPLGR